MYQQALGVLLALSLSLTFASATIVLGQFQTIENFPRPCEDAYNLPIYGCDASDFPRSCSSQCVYALEQAQATIDNACAGTQVTLDSLIGQMFVGNGAQFLCTENITLGSSPSSTSSGYYDSANSFSSTAAPPSTATKSSASSDTTTASPSSSKVKSTRSTSSTIRRTSTLSVLRSTASSTSGDSASSSTSPSSSSASTESQASDGFVTTAFNNGVATTLTSHAQRTSAASTNPDAFGGGGSPFEVGPNGNDATRAVVAGSSMLIGMFALGFSLLR